jgi:predicted PurR-regulated permease PerM
MTLTKVASLFIILAAIFALLILGESLLIPFVIAVFVWYIINALSHWIGEFKFIKKHFPDWAKLAISTLIIAFILVIVGGLITENARGMINALPKYEKNLGFLIEKIGNIFNFDTTQFFRFSGSEKVPDIFGNIKNFLSQIDIGAAISRLVNTLSGIAGNAFLIIIYVLFLLFEQAIFPKKIRALFPEEDRYEQYQNIMTHINEAIRAYFSVKLLTSLITAFASYILMAIIGLDFAIFWAFLIFILNFIPNIGSLIATIFPALLALIQFETLTPFLVILIGVGTIQVIVGNLIEPRMMGSSLNISSLVVILALSLWGVIWGITGMILSVPITVILMIILAEFPATRPIAILLSEKGELMHELEEIHQKELKESMKEEFNEEPEPLVE